MGDNELRTAKLKIADTERKIAKAEAEEKEDLILVYGKILAGLQEKENILSQPAGKCIDSHSRGTLSVSICCFPWR